MRATTVLKEARKLLDEFPDPYDATMDRLTTPQEHAETVNRLLASLRAVVKIVEERRT